MNPPVIHRIDRIELMTVRLKLVSPFETSFSVQRDRDALLLKLSSDGLSGWGECVAGLGPFYSYETNETARHIVRDFLIPMLTAALPATVGEAVAKFDHVRGHNMAKAMVENALLDLAARMRGVPLWQFIGGRLRRIMSGISIGIQPDVERLLDTIGRAVERKYGRIKLKIKRGRDVEVLEKVRERFPEIRLMADANSDYRLDDAAHLKRLDAFRLMMIEQPLGHDDIYQHSLLQRNLQTPICLDESILSLDDARTAAELKSCRIINIKQGRVGGILNSAKMEEFCRTAGIPVWSGGMLETGIGRAFNIHLQTLPGFVLPGDTSETSRYFAEDIVEPEVTLDEEGMIVIPAGPGTGVTVREDRLKKYRVSSEILLPG
jgi:O-succinylbenzoate synthase